MKILLLHLSDIHLKTDGNSIKNNREQISKAIQNKTLEMDKLFILISGDIAYSGKMEEYLQAIEMLDSLKSDLENYSGKKVHCIIIPGNHDCDFETENQKVRETLIKDIQQRGNHAIDNGVIEQCCGIQRNFFDHSELFHEASKIVYGTELLTIMDYQFDDYNIILNCYNTAWISQLKEQPGKMYFPTKTYPKEHLNKKANIVISLLHHPFHWQNPENARQFRKHVEETSDLVITGHEHVASSSIKDSLDGNHTEFIEGAVLQDWENSENSEFNLIFLDLEHETQKILKYSWNGGRYEISSETDDWFPYKRKKSFNKKGFEINNEFERRLNDPGASFTHPNKSELTLKDLFVFPNLQNMGLEKTKAKDVMIRIVDSEKLCQINKNGNKYLIIGAEKSGKTSLSMILYKHYYFEDYVPIYIDGTRIKSKSIEEFNKLVNRVYTEQYSKETLEAFSQLENSKKLLIIDDYDKSKPNIKYKAVLIRSINQLYPNIIITAHDLFQVEELIYEQKQKKFVFEKYQQYKILEFGHFLRNNLINKWNTLGQEEFLEEVELTRRNNNARQIIDTIIGKNFVPGYPIFLLTILQTIEFGNSHNLKESSYGYYYEFLITHALSKIIKSDEIDAYYSYISELANYLFENELWEISKENLLNDFHKWFCTEYKIRLNFDKHIEDLVNAFILDENQFVIKFRYKYVYYFFVAKYISDNITSKDIKNRISEMCKRLYRGEFSNIIMFLTHHSKNPIILENILAEAKKIFSDFEPIRFENDTSQINNLLDEIPKLVLRNIDIKENREKKLKQKDEIELTENDDSNDEETYDLKEEIVELDIITKLNLGFKLIEIIGQVLKNYYGSLKGTTKFKLAEESYLIGLRALNSFFSILEKLSEKLAEDINSVIAQKKIEDKEQIQEVARKFLFQFYLFGSFAFIKKVSNFIGSEKLSETFIEILEKNDFVSFHLVDMSIKLDFFRAFPYDDISKVKKRISGKLLPYTLLKQLVIDHLYMFPTSYQEKQKICSKLDISMDTQRAIDKTSTQKKKV